MPSSQGKSDFPHIVGPPRRRFAIPLDLPPLPPAARLGGVVGGVFLLLGVALLGSRAPKAQAASGIDWSRNIGLLVLDAERNLYGQHVLLTPDRQVTVEDNYALLEHLLDEGERRLTGDTEATPDPLQVLLTIHRLLVEEGFTYRDYTSWEYRLLGFHLFHYGLARREIDCAMYVYIYLAIAERIGLPLVGVNVPEHLALRWEPAQGESFNWEATVPNRCDDAFYVEWKSPSRTAIANGVYLQPLSKEEVLGLALYETGLTLRARKRPDDALAAANRAIRLAPRYPDAYNLRGLVLSATGHLDDAVASYAHAIELDPGFAHAYFNRALSWIALDRPAEAARDLAVLEELDEPLATRLRANLENS